MCLFCFDSVGSSLFVTKPGFPIVVIAMSVFCHCPMTVAIAFEAIGA